MSEFQVWAKRSEEDIEFYSQVDGPRDQALREAYRYAAQVVNDGDTAIIEEVTRVIIETLPPKGNDREGT